MRLTPLDMGDHFNLGRIAWRSSQLYDEDFYCRSSPQTDLSEIFAVASFSTFSTVSAQSRHPGRRFGCPLSGAERTCVDGAAMSANDPQRTCGRSLMGLFVTRSEKLLLSSGS
jgi:hypothetical protein